MSPSRARWIGWLIVGLWLTLPAWMGGARPNEYEARIVDDAEARERRNLSAVAQLFGEFRVGLSDIMFVKTELYLHGGVAYAPHLDMDRMAQAQGVEHEEDDHEADTRIPPPERDWRGFIGTLEREVKPWLHPDQPHVHGGGRELLPWYWLLVKANPRNTRGYRMGAYWLSTIETEQALAEAIRFLNDGIENNPENFLLYKARGQLEWRLGRLDDAFASLRTAVRIGVKQRPDEGLDSPEWDEDREEELSSAMRYLIFVLEEKAAFTEALQVVRLFERVFPNDHSIDVARRRVRHAFETGRTQPFVPEFRKDQMEEFKSHLAPPDGHHRDHHDDDRTGE